MKGLYDLDFQFQLHWFFITISDLIGVFQKSNVAAMATGALFGFVIGRYGVCRLLKSSSSSSSSSCPILKLKVEKLHHQLKQKELEEWKNSLPKRLPKTQTNDFCSPDDWYLK